MEGTTNEGYDDVKTVKRVHEKKKKKKKEDNL